MISIFWKAVQKHMYMIIFMRNPFFTIARFKTNPCNHYKRSRNNSCINFIHEIAVGHKKIQFTFHKTKRYIVSEHEVLYSLLSPIFSSGQNSWQNDNDLYSESFELSFSNKSTSKSE